MRNVISILFISILMTGCVLQNYHYANFKPSPRHSLRLASYNLYWKNGTCALSHPKSTTRLIRRINADILFIQEVTPKLKQCLTKTLASQYPYRKFHFYGNEGGLAMLSKYPFTSRFYILPKNGWYPAWIVNVHTPYGDIQTLNLHLRPQVVRGDHIGLLAKALFTTPKIREQEIKQFYPYLRFGVPTVIAGDFNEEDQGRAVRFLQKIGFIDTMRYNPYYTWKVSFGPFTLAKRFDRIFLSPHFHLDQVQVLHESSSDHYPVVVDVNLN